MGVPTIKTGPMTVEEYFAFTDTRPDDEKWELIDGEPVLNASPSGLHQRIVWKLLILLGTAGAAAPRVLGRAFPVSACGFRILSFPEPDVFVLPQERCRRDPYSRETRRRDRRLRNSLAIDRRARLALEAHAYTGLASLTHYVVIAQDAVDVVVFARDAGFAERHIRSTRESLELPSLGISLPLADIYRDTGLD